MLGKSPTCCAIALTENLFSYPAGFGCSELGSTLSWSPESELSLNSKAKPAMSPESAESELQIYAPFAGYSGAAGRQEPGVHESLCNSSEKG